MNNVNEMTEEQRADLAVSLIERAAAGVLLFARELRDSTLRPVGRTAAGCKLERAMQALEGLNEMLEVAPDVKWHRDHALLTGDHWVLTDEGWMPAEHNSPEVIGDDEPCEVLDEVNALAAPNTAGKGE